VTCGLVQLEVEARDPASAFHEMDELFPVREMSAEQEVVIATRRQLENTGIVVDDDRPSVGGSGDLLDAGNRPGREEGDHRVPVERPVEREPQHETAVGNEAVGCASPRPQLAWRHSEQVTAGAVELAHAPEA
jgi:hypothetical protein